MGTDVHAVWQKKDPGLGDKYWDVPEGDWEQSRHYLLFAWLADVRNGYGFAGVPTHDPIVPIAKPRGLPEDFLLDTNDCHWGKWMGDHSHSWLMADEILNAPRPDNGNCTRTGVISAEQFAKWDGKSAPDSWSGGISGPGVKVAASAAVFKKEKGYTHVTVEWPMEPELDYFIDEVKRMREKHGPTLRLVFGFDS